MEMSGQLNVSAVLLPGRKPGITEQEAAWDPEYVWKFWRMKSLPEFESGSLKITIIGQVSPTRESTLRDCYIAF
jgi:hypothetical protein